MGIWKCTMENLVNHKTFWHNKSVLVTGHTGFKGGWLSLWLDKVGAKVSGYALKPTEENNFYNSVYAKGFVGTEIFADIANSRKLSGYIKKQKPSFIFHLAAQPLVRSSYLNPVETFKTNALGVVNLFEAVRSCSFEPTIINVTTDKVYKTKDVKQALSEVSELGGDDPYSASKTCSEIITNCYKNSYFEKTNVKIATVRAGNVIGGGDMATDRLIPDYFRSLLKNTEIVIRNPKAIRPWQHVLEPVSGYIKLAEKLSSENGSQYEGSWNFAPSNGIFEVGEIIGKLCKITGGKEYKVSEKSNLPESQSIILDSSKAMKKLNWKPKLKIDEALSLTYAWFSRSLVDDNMKEFSMQQIMDYQKYG